MQTTFPTKSHSRLSERRVERKHSSRWCPLSDRWLPIARSTITWQRTLKIIRTLRAVIVALEECSDCFFHYFSASGFSISTYQPKFACGPGVSYFLRSLATTTNTDAYFEQNSHLQGEKQVSYVFEVRNTEYTPRFRWAAKMTNSASSYMFQYAYPTRLLCHTNTRPSSHTYSYSTRYRQRMPRTYMISPVWISHGNSLGH